jgi:hypothetical protein
MYRVDSRAQPAHRSRRVTALDVDTAFIRITTKEHLAVERRRRGLWECLILARYAKLGLYAGYPHNSDLDVSASLRCSHGDSTSSDILIRPRGSHGTMA